MRRRCGVIAVNLAIVVLILFLVLIGFSGADFFSNKEQFIAKVGDIKITKADYSTAYAEEVNYIQQLLNRKLTSEQLRSLDVKKSVFRRLIERALLVNFSRSFGLMVTEENIEAYTKDVSAFQDESGHFSKEKFLRVLSGGGISEAEYVKNLKEGLPVFVLMSSLFDARDFSYLGLPKDIMRALYCMRYQSRVVDVLKISPNNIKVSGAPTDERLRKIFAVKKDNLKRPEYRSFAYVNLSAELVKDKVKVSAKEVDDYIKSNKLDDQRDLINLVFATEGEAKDAMNSIKKGSITFNALLKKHSNPGSGDAVLNNVTRDMLPPDIRDKVFAMNVGEVSPVLKSVFGWHLMKVKSIHKVISPAGLEELRKSVRSDLVSNGTKAALNSELEDIAAKIKSGAKFFDVMKKFHLKIYNSGLVDIKGDGESGSNRFVFGIQNASQRDSGMLLRAAFSIDAKSDVESNFFTGDEKNYYFIHLNSVVKSRNLKFGEARDELVGIWRNEEMKSKMKDFAYQIIKNIKSGSNPEKLKGVRLDRNVKLFREEVASVENPGQNYSHMFLSEVFSAKVNGVTSPYEQDSGLIVGILRGIVDPVKPSDIMLSDLKKIVTRDVFDGMREQFISYLGDKYKIIIYSDDFKGSLPY